MKNPFSRASLDVAKYIKDNNLSNLEVKENYHKDEDNFRFIVDGWPNMTTQRMAGGQWPALGLNIKLNSG